MRLLGAGWARAEKITSPVIRKVTVCTGAWMEPLGRESCCRDASYLAYFWPQVRKGSEEMPPHAGRCYDQTT